MLQWMAIRVALARREFGVAYPAMYKNDGGVFDCTQRAHQNTLETAPAQMVLVALLGLAHPVPAAAAQAAWVGGRVAYALGYSTGDPSKRLPGVAVSGLVYVATIGAALVEGAKMVLGG
jgi:glutathione S-transferase